MCLGGTRPENRISAARTAWFPMDAQVREAETETGMGGEHGTDL